MAKSSKTLQTLFSLFILLNFFTIVLTEEVEYDSSTHRKEVSVSASAKKANPYTLKFKYASDMPYYVKVTLKPKETQDTPSLCYSPTDANCKSDRVVLASRVDKKPIVACVKRDEIPYNQKNLNILVTCKKDSCGYDLLFEGQDKCQIPF